MSTATAKYIPHGFAVTSWGVVEPFYKELVERPVNSATELAHWLADRSALEAFLSEDFGWRYIKMNCDTENEALVNDFTFFVTEIQPKSAPYEDMLNRKFMSSEYLGQLDNYTYEVLVRSIKKQLELYREENIPVYTEIENTQHEYGSITGKITVEIDGKELTLPQAANYYKSSDRAIREEVFNKVSFRRLQDKEVLNDLFDKLLKLRNQIALNAGYKNFRDYMFDALGRFDYTVDDCYNFHESVKQYVKPICDTIDAKRKTALGYEALYPWDTEVDIEGKEPLKPSESTAEMLEKAIQCFYDIDTYFGDCLKQMREMGRLDLESRKGKAPGGFNYPLYESGVPFIYMNAANNMRDLITIVHEGGHAIHSFLTQDLALTEFKSTPSEIAEVASMAMELISLEHWGVFFTDTEDLKRAKRYQLEKAISGLPWIAQIDKFQHWIYLHPEQTAEERNAYWLSLCSEFGSSVIDWSKLQESLSYQWQKQLHLYEVPFYYIEYGFAQLGAIAIWRNYKNDPAKTLQQYKDALKLGYTRPLPELYEAAGVRFDFSAAYIKELAEFIQEEIAEIK